MREDENADEIEWRDGKIPVSTRFDDPYFSISNGLQETEHVFLNGNDLEARLTSSQNFHIAELGFGTGLNFLSLCQLFDRVAPPDAKLTFTSFELYPLEKFVMEKALEPWAELEPYRREFIKMWPAARLDTDFCADLGRCQLDLKVGDANQRILEMDNTVDAWFLDGFSPAKNPELWNEAILSAVYDKTKPGGTFATYSAAGWVRDLLTHAGFEVLRVPGFGRKKHMTVGRRG